MKNKRFLLAGLAILTVFAMLACGGGGSDPATDPNRIDITFNPNYTGATSLVINITKGTALGSANLAQVTAKQNRGAEWEFKGWVETQDGTVPVSITQNSTWNENKTYYGTWGAITPAGEPVEITFDLNGLPETVQQPEAKEATSGTAIGPSFLPTLTLPQGYAWLGWSRDADGTTYVGATTVFNSDTTLYARFVQPNMAGTASINMANGTLDADFLDLTRAAISTATSESGIGNGIAQYTLNGLYVANDRNNLYVALQIPEGFQGFRYDRLVLLIDNTTSDADTGGTPAAPTIAGGKPGEHEDFAPFIVINENITGTVEARAYMRLIDWAQGPKGVTGASVNITKWNVGAADPFEHSPVEPSTGSGQAGVVKFAIPLSEIGNAGSGTELKVFAAFSMGWDQGPYPGSWVPANAVTAFADEWKSNAADVIMDINMADALSYTVKMSDEPGNITLIYDMDDLPGAVVANKTIPSGVIGQAGLPVVEVDDIDFNGWSLTRKGTALTASDSITVNATTLYALWDVSPNVVARYNVNGLPGGIAPANSVFPKNTAIGTLPDPTGYDPVEYTFQGWARTPVGTVADIIDATEVFPNTATLYARWIPNTITITYNLNGFPAAKPDDKTVTTGVALDSSALPALTPTNADYTFQGWATTPVGTVLTTSDTLDENTTLFVRHTFSGARDFSAINMSTGTLDADFSTAKAVRTTSVKDGGTSANSPAEYPVTSLSVANDGDYLYVALELGATFAVYDKDTIVVLIGNASQADGAGKTAGGAWEAVATTENITGNVAARVYLRPENFMNGTTPQGPWGVNGASHNITSVQAGATENNWLWKFLAPDNGGVLKFKIPLGGLAQKGTELKVFASISMGWGGGSTPNVGVYAPEAAAPGASGATIDINMANALSYTVK